MKKLVLFLLAAVLIISYSCEKKPTSPTSKKPTFIINGVVVKDMNDPAKDIASFTVWRNGALFDSATVKVGNQNIPNTGSGVYYDSLSYNTFHSNTTYIDSIISPQDTVTITFGFLLPDTFSISINPADSVNEGGLAVNVFWTASDSADGYIIGVAKGDTISGAMLYSATVGEPLAPIPIQAFHKTGLGDVVPGIYWVYVIAYKESFVSYADLRFELPAGLPANNITGANGTIGAGVIAEKVTIRVP